MTKHSSRLVVSANFGTKKKQDEEMVEESTENSSASEIMTSKLTTKVTEVYWNENKENTE